MGYETRVNVKSYAGFTTADDNTLLDSLILVADEIIDSHCETTFDVSAETSQVFNRYNNMPDHVTAFSGRTILFHDWLAEEASSVTDSPTLVYLPEDGPPYYGAWLQDGSWADDSVSITGYWGYSKDTDVPEAIKQACKRLVKWLYDMKDTYNGMEAIVTPEGQVILPEGLPYDVVLLLAPYRRTRVV